MTCFTAVASWLFPWWARRRAKKRQKRCSISANSTEKEDPSDTSASCNELRKETSSDVLASRSLLFPQQISTNDAGIGRPSEPLEAIYSDTHNGHPSIPALNKDFIAISGKKIVSNPENPLNGASAQKPGTIFGLAGTGGLGDQSDLGAVVTDQQQEVISGLNKVDQPGIRTSGLLSGVSGEEVPDKISPLDLDKEAEYKEAPTSDDEGDGQSSRTITLCKEAPSAQLLTMEGSTKVNESANLAYHDHEDQNVAGILNRLMSLRVQGFQLDDDGFMTEVVDTCQDPNIASTLYAQSTETPTLSLAKFLVNLARHCLSLHTSSGDPSYIAKSIGFVNVAKDAIRSTNEANLMPDCRGIYDAEGHIYYRRFEHFGLINDIEIAICAWGRATEWVEDDNPSAKARLLSNLGTSLRIRFEQLGEQADIDKAIVTQEQAVNLSSDEHPDKPYWLDGLGTSSFVRFERLGDITDLDSAILRQQQAVDLMPDGYPNKASPLNNLGNSLFTRFEELGDMTDLDNAIVAQQQAVNLTLDEHPDKPSLLSNLGNSLLARFDELGEVADVNNAILRHQQAVDVSPGEHPHKSFWLDNLGCALFARFERLGEVADIDNAILRQQQALDLTPDEHPDKLSLLNSLGFSFLARFERHKDAEDIDNAILRHQQAVDHTPDGNPNKLSLLSNLGNSLLARFEWFRDIVDINNAILAQRQAVELTPDEHPKKPSRLDNLGISFFRRFEQLGEIADIDNAILIQQQAVDLTPVGHVDRPSWLNNLGSSLQARLSHQHTPEDLSRLTSTLHEAAHSPSGALSARFDATQKLANLLYPQLDPYRALINLVPQIVLFGRTDNQPETLKKLGDAVVEAVSAACAAEEYDLALEWAEYGQAIIWNQRLRLRSPMGDLRNAHRNLANELNRLAVALEVAGTRITELGEGTLSLEEVAQEHLQLADQWEDTLAVVRKLPDFGHFLTPVPASILKQAATGKTMVVVNVSRYRSDALILQPGASFTSHVHLRTVSPETLNSAHDDLTHSLRLCGAQGRDANVVRKPALDQLDTNQVLPYILKLLWIDIAKPILDYLGYTTGPSPANNLRHVTWCCTGALLSLPLHAAGLYDVANGQDKLYKYVISSYTTSLTSLIKGQEQKSTTTPTTSLLAITPSPTGSPGTVREVDRVQIKMEKYKVPLTRIDGDQATVKSVSEAMNTHSWLYLARRGMQDAQKPIKSVLSLPLHDGQLELGEIMKKPLKHAELAYLSASQTPSGYAELPNEAIHLAAGMFMAGYRAVIAGLWHIGEQDGPIVAEAFYEYLLSNPEGGVAEALHEAVAVLRELVGEENLRSWAPYIHIGY